MKRVSSPFLTALALSVLSLGNLARAEDLVPAAMGLRTDAAGNSWSIESDGSLGRLGSTILNGGLSLTIDDVPFECARPLMTPDGGEIVLDGSDQMALAGIEVQRRIRVMPSTGGLRYAEIFYNGTADSIALTASLQSSFSSNYQTYLTDRGRSEVLRIDERETGLIVMPGASQSARALLFTLAGDGSPLRPTVSASSRYQLDFLFSLDLDAGETAVIVHEIAQIPIPQSYDRRALLSLFSPFQFSNSASLSNQSWTRFIRNVAERESAEKRTRIPGLAELGVAPTVTDLLLIGNETRVPGETTGSAVVISTSFGEAEIALSRIAAIRGMRPDGPGSTRVFLRDGQILSGEMTAADLEFLPIGGDRIELATETIDRIVFAKGDEAAPVEGAFVETYDGNLFYTSVKPDVTLTARTAWGSFTFSLNEVVRFGSRANSGDPSGGFGKWLVLKDGTRCLVLLPENEIALSSNLLNDLTSLSTSQIRAIHPVDRGEGERREKAVRGNSLVELSGNQSIAGKLTDSSIEIVSSGQKIAIETSQIRRIEQLEGRKTSASGLPIDTLAFEIERWDGGILTGSIIAPAFTISLLGESWRIPQRDIEKITLPQPPPTLEKQKLIEALIDDLSANDWMTRESATVKLGAFGYLARPQLETELGTTEDPEVIRRIELILSDLN